LRAVYDGVLDPKLTFFTDEAWFHLSGYINAQNNRYWSSINPRQTFEVPLHDQNIGVWCAITLSRIVGPIFFKTILIQSGMSVTFYVTFFGSITEEEKTWLFYARWYYSTHCHLFHKCFKRSV
jgi:hypothetical protein